MGRGYLLLVLHAHLPFVRHPEHDDFFEERWLFEAITESYLPLLRRLERLSDEGVAYRLTLSISPTLASMLRDPLLQGRYLAHLERLSDLAGREVARTRKDAGLAPLARYYRDLFAESRDLFERRLGRDLLGGFLRLADAGGLELITTAATHGYLPLLRAQPQAVRAQLQVAADYFLGWAGRPAPGVWLPECGFYPGLEEELGAAGFHYFFLESHGLLHGQPRPRYGVRSPLACPGGLAAFARDPGCSRDVWSRDQGYPGHPLYREFHQDIGGELSAAQLGPLASAGPTGIKYHRIGDRRGPSRDLYCPAAARAQAEQDAADFLSRRRTAGGAAPPGRTPPLFVAPYDAELFGHWWHEGPAWLEQVLRRAADRGSGIETLTASDYLERHPRVPAGRPSGSSWGEGGYNRFWLDRPNAWVYPHLHQAAQDMRTLARAHPDAAPGSPRQRILSQAGRSLLLAQASDWAFIMRTGAGAQYALDRVRNQLARFRFLCQALRDGGADPRRLSALEAMDNLFPELDYRVFAA